MIVNVPSPKDFADHGVDFLNLAWTAALDMLIELHESAEWSGEVDPEVESDFWAATERELATALSLTEQGAEFLLKSKICSVSPWLLFSGGPSEWPRKCENQDVDYAEFRTLDAQDLVKVHDTFAQQRLHSDFKDFFSSLRRERNSIIHTVDKRIKPSASNIVEKVLLISDYLIGPQMWVSARREYMVRDKFSALAPDSTEYRMAIEFLIASKLLRAEQSKKFFGFNKKQRGYCCPRCSHSNSDIGFECVTALLRPNTANSRTVYCFVCDTEWGVERRKCSSADCKGNVFSPDWGVCLTCLESD